jgi:glycosyltransferase involved in cell wall biosynthesis
MTPLISVVMPVRNGTKWLHEAVESVLDQEFRDFELLIVDDGSDEDTVRRLAEIARADGRIGVLHQAPQGVAVALNLGIGAARAPYIARLDADDLARPDRLARQLAFMQAHGDVDLVGSAAQVIDGAGAVIGRIAPPTESGRIARHLRRGNPIIHSSVMMRAGLLHQLGGYRATFGAAEDYDLWLRIAETGGIANLPEPLVAIRRHESNLSRLNAVRQSFSVRLAQRSAAARRAGTGDPAAALTAPPDWWAAEATTMFFAPDVGFYRFLDSDRATAPEYVRAVQSRLFSLNHVERKLAQARLKAMLHEGGSGSSFGMPHLWILLLIALLHPARALSMAWRAGSAAADEGESKRFRR